MPCTRRIRPALFAARLAPLYFLRLRGGRRRPSPEPRRGSMAFAASAATRRGRPCWYPSKETGNSSHSERPEDMLVRSTVAGARSAHRLGTSCDDPARARWHAPTWCLARVRPPRWRFAPPQGGHDPGQAIRTTPCFCSTSRTDVYASARSPGGRGRSRGPPAGATRSCSWPQRGREAHRGARPLASPSRAAMQDCRCRCWWYVRCDEQSGDRSSPS